MPEKTRKQEFLEEFSLDLGDMSEFDLLEGRNHLLPGQRPFLNLYSHQEIEALLEKAGILIALRRKGFPDFSIEFDTENLDDQRLTIKDKKTGEILVFMRLHLGDFITRNLSINLSGLRLLFIDWLLLQNPLAHTETLSKLFPGQKYPGLGIFNEIKQFVYYIVRDKQLDGAANLPEFFHDAVLFADKFLFINPVSQGYFDALRTQLRREGLRRLSNLIHSGKVMIEQNSEKRVFEFRLGEMMVPHREDLEYYFRSKSYREPYAKALSSVKFSVVA